MSFMREWRPQPLGPAFAPLATLLATVLLSGCGMGEFNLGRAKNVGEGAPFSIGSEQVVLTEAQVNCGVESGLWEEPAPQATRTVARLTEQGRALKFADDVVIGEFPQPYTQVRGSFILQFDEISNIRDGQDPSEKLVDARAGVKIEHPCFATPLPFMAVKRGQFRQGAPVVFKYINDGGWKLAELMHQ